VGHELDWLSVAWWRAPVGASAAPARRREGPVGHEDLEWSAHQLRPTVAKEVGHPSVNGPDAGGGVGDDRRPDGCVDHPRAVGVRLVKVRDVIEADVDPLAERRHDDHSRELASISAPGREQKDGFRGIDTSPVERPIDRRSISSRHQASDPGTNELTGCASKDALAIRVHSGDHCGRVDLESGRRDLVKQIRPSLLTALAATFVRAASSRDSRQ
jgi:hypothetical protein